MPLTKPLAPVSFLVLGLMTMLSSGCVVAEPNDGYYDRGHHRSITSMAGVNAGIVTSTVAIAIEIAIDN